MMPQHTLKAILGSALLAACAVLSGCATAPAPLAHTPEFAPVFPAPAEKSQVQTGAIFSARHSDNWFGRGKTFQVGDVVTVLLNEETQTERKVDANINRTASNTVVPDGITSRVQNLALPTRILGTRLSGAMSGANLKDAEIKTAGSGSESKKASLIGAVTVTVIEVLNNGNLMVRGEKQLALTEGAETIQLSGIIRPVDVSPSNMVQSSRLANAQISYRGTGDLANATKAGWGTSWLLKVWPF
jgi:flagellar L-ring protein precursor FlgH